MFIRENMFISCWEVDFLTFGQNQASCCKLFTVVKKLTKLIVSLFLVFMLS